MDVAFSPTCGSPRRQGLGRDACGAVSPAYQPIEERASGIGPTVASHNSSPYIQHPAHGAAPQVGKVTPIVIVDGLRGAKYCGLVANPLAGN